MGAMARLFKDSAVVMEASKPETGQEGQGGKPSPDAMRENREKMMIGYWYVQQKHHG